MLKAVQGRIKNCQNEKGLMNQTQFHSCHSTIEIGRADSNGLSTKRTQKQNQKVGKSLVRLPARLGIMGPKSETISKLESHF